MRYRFRKVDIKIILSTYIEFELFYSQDIMNREKEDELPEMQVNFIDNICLPIYQVIKVLDNIF